MTARTASLALLTLSVALAGCLWRKPSTPTPTPPPSVTATVSSPPTPTPAAPTATLIPITTVLPTVSAKLLPTAAVSAVVARHETQGTFGIAALNSVALQPGHSYRLLVESASGIAAFYGQWSTSAVGTDGMLGVDAGLLDARTPASYDIVPPVAAVARDWIYSASVQNKGSGSIALAIVDVTPGG